MTNDVDRMNGPSTVTKVTPDEMTTLLASSFDSVSGNFAKTALGTQGVDMLIGAKSLREHLGPDAIERARATKLVAIEVGNTLAGHRYQTDYVGVNRAQLEKFASTGTVEQLTKPVMQRHRTYGGGPFGRGQ